MEAMQFEPMSVGRIVDRTFAIYRNNFLRFVTIVAIIQVPIGLLSLISNSYLATGVHVQKQAASEPMEEVPPTEEETAPGDNEDRTAKPVPALFGWLGMIIASLLALIGGLLSQAALTKSISEVYMGREITVGQAYSAIFPRFLSLLAAAILVAIVVWLGFLLLVVPGVIFALWLYVTTPSIVVENCSATEGMSRSKALVSGNLGKVFAVGLVAVLITWIIAIPLSFVGEVAARTLFVHNLVLGTSVKEILNVLAHILATPIAAAASILVYYDLRIRKEGFDLEMLAKSMNEDQG